MFGDKPILGQVETIIDDKNRLNLPKYTNKEQGDELVLIYDNDTENYKIFSASKYLENIEKLKENLSNAKNKKEEIYYKKRIIESCKSILRMVTVDSKGRIVVGNLFERQNTVLLTGIYDHVILEPVKKK